MVTVNRHIRKRPAVEVLQNVTVIIEKTQKQAMLRNGQRKKKSIAKTNRVCFKDHHHILLCFNIRLSSPSPSPQGNEQAVHAQEAAAARAGSFPVQLCHAEAGSADGAHASFG
jgi:hypothetical protein